jgi:pimeloyl-ACP methyl ester carboxylesterase
MFAERKQKDAEPMPHTVSRGAKIYFEEVGSGTPILCLHEYAGDYRSWRDFVRYFSRGYRCITMSARGYPPSDVPEKDADYGQELANLDALAVLDHLGIQKAHVVGHSMGAFTSLQLCIRAPERLISAIPTGAGSGSLLATQAEFRAESKATSDVMERSTRIDAEGMGESATRIQLKVKDPIGWQEMVDNLASHPPAGSARVLRNVQGKRPSLYEQEAELSRVKTPVLLIVGDEDEPCLDVNLFMKRIMMSAQLAMLPGTGHALTLEEPALLHLLMERFLASVDRGTWRPRHPKAAVKGKDATPMFGRT